MTDVPTAPSPLPVEARTKTDWAFLLALILVPVGVVLLVIGALLHQGHFLHLIGVEPRSPSTAYNFWSGFGSDLGEYAIAVGLFSHLIGFYRLHNCREHRCWKPGFHVYHDEHGQPHPACAQHHPTHPHRHGQPFHFEHLHAAKIASTASKRNPR